MVDIDYYKNLYFLNGFDVPYALKKGGEVLISPIKLKDAYFYDWAIDVLNIQKNELGDVDIIQMSYLDFLVKVLFKKDKEYEDKLRYLIFACLGEEYVSFEQDKGKSCVVICDEKWTVQKIINHKEFDEISKIILNQNNAKYDNRYVSPEVRQMMEEYCKIKYKDIEPPSLEKKKSFVCSKIGKTYSEISGMNYREFEMIYSALVDSEVYLATKITEASYKYEVKNPTSHPMFEKEKDPYSEIFEDTSVLNGKGINGTGHLGNFDVGE